MTLTYYGHCAFLWTSAQGIRVLIDPFGNSESSYWFPRPFPPTEADVVLVTHDHFDHNATNGLPGSPTLLRGPGAFRLQDVQIEGVLDVHSAGPGARGMANTLFVIEIDRVRYCHIGDNRHDVPEDVRARLGRVDVLMVTVDDSCHLLSYAQVDALVDALDPRVVVPMHYYIEGLTTKGSTRKAPAGWLASRSPVRAPDPLVIIALATLETTEGANDLAISARERSNMAGPFSTRGSSRTTSLSSSRHGQTIRRNALFIDCNLRAIPSNSGTAVRFRTKDSGEKDTP